MYIVRVLAVACLVVGLVSPSPVEAWARDGHRIVCDLAWRHLNDEARLDVERLIALDPQFDDFREMCSWADLVRGSSHRMSGPWHYTNQRRDDPRIDYEDCANTGCIISAVDAHATIFADRARSDADRLEALKFLAHWLGDIHQPLHVSIEGDRGGNNVPVLWRGTRRTNLHRVWDREILRDHMAELWPDLPANDRWAAFSQSRAGAPSDIPATAILDPIAWAQESHDIVRSESFAFYWPDADQPVQADEAYYQRNRLIVAERLELGGLRLANLLNHLVTERNLRAASGAQITGSLD
jgi:hypothetical protein